MNSTKILSQWLSKIPGAKQLSRLSEPCDPKRQKKKTANSATKKDWKFKWFGHRYWSVWVKVFPAQQTEIQRLKKVSAWQNSQILYNSR